MVDLRVLNAPTGAGGVSLNSDQDFWESKYVHILKSLGFQSLAVTL